MNVDALHACDIRRREARALLVRMVKYVREDQAVTPGTTRLARLTDEVDAYLKRTHDPSDILRSEVSAASEPITKFLVGYDQAQVIVQVNNFEFRTSPENTQRFIAALQEAVAMIRRGEHAAHMAGAESFADEMERATEPEPHGHP